MKLILSNQFMSADVSYAAAENAIFTAADFDPEQPLAVRVAALVAAREGRLFSVCCYCATEQMKTATRDLDNITHGCCPGCVDAVSKQLAEEFPQ